MSVKIKAGSAVGMELLRFIKINMKSDERRRNLEISRSKAKRTQKTMEMGPE